MNEPSPVIYIVDDDEGVCQSLSSLFRSVGLAARTFDSAREFLNARLADAPSCLVLDVRLPGLSGLDLQQELADRDIQIPIIFLTGHADIPMTVQAMKAGAVEFLTKPFRDQDLLDAVHSALDRDRAARQAQGGSSGPARAVRFAYAARTRGHAPRRYRDVKQAGRRGAGHERGHRETSAGPGDAQDGSGLGRGPGAHG